MEVELKFQVPPARREALRRAVATRTAQRTRLQAIYADTADDRLAVAQLALRLRKEGRLWVQTLKGRGDGLMQRLEHEVPLPAQRGEPALDPARHAGTPVGEQLLRVLLADGGAPAELAPLYRTDIQRLHRTLSAGGARIELALDEGWILAGAQRLAVFEIEFELKSGPPAALLALAQKWAQRFGLVWDVRTKSERGFRLAHGLLRVPAVRAPAVSWPREARGPGKGADQGAAAKDGKKSRTRRQPAAPGCPSTPQAWSALLLSALNQVLPNAAELACAQRDSTPAPARAAVRPVGAGPQEAGHVANQFANDAADAAHLHQLRVGLRRLRTVLGLCADWGPDPAAARALQLAWREPFTRLGAARDGDVLGGGLWPEIQAAGGAGLSLPVPAFKPASPADDHAGALPTEPAALLREPAFNLLLLQSLALALPALPVGSAAAADSGASPGDEASSLPAAATHLLAATWRQVRRDAARFDHLPLARQHRTRRRLKRLRYLLEGLLALPGDLGWPRSALRRWHRRLCRALDALGRYNDLCMAGEALALATAQAAKADPSAWFARGWLAAQQPLAMASAGQALQRLVDTPTPWPKRG